MKVDRDSIVASSIMKSEPPTFNESWHLPSRTPKLPTLKPFKQKESQKDKRGCRTQPKKHSAYSYERVSRDITSEKRAGRSFTYLHS